MTETPRAVLLTPVDPAEVIEVLGDAFREYPVMRFVLGGPLEPGDRRLNRLVQLFVMARIFRKEPVFGVRIGGGLAAVALLSNPDGPPAPSDFLRFRDEVWADLGDECRERYEAFGAACHPLLVGSPHLHLNMIGVRPEVQGSGLSTLLLNAAHEMASEREGCTGVTLTTEDPRNLSFYSRFGYRVTGHARVGDGLETWAHFRPTHPDALSATADGEA